MVSLKITQSFMEHIEKACANYKSAWKYIVDNELLSHSEFLGMLSKYGMDAKACYSAGRSFPGCPGSLSKWQRVMHIIKKLASMQDEDEDTATDTDHINSQTSSIIAEEEITIETLASQLKRLETELRIAREEIRDLRDIVSKLQAERAGYESDRDAVDFMDALGLDDSDRHTPEELEVMKHASMDDFEHMIRFNEPLTKSSSKGVVDVHAIHNAKSSFAKGNDISPDAETTTSIVYDTSDPTISKREVELREAKQAVLNIIHKKDADKKHPDLDERKQRWLDAVRKSRLQKGLGVDIKVLQESGFSCEDPNETIFTQ